MTTSSTYYINTVTGATRNVNVISSSSGGQFMIMDIQRTDLWPGHPPRPSHVGAWMLGKGSKASTMSKEEIDQQAIGLQVNPRPYFRWIRAVLRNAWAYVRFLPPGSSIPIMRDRQGADYRDIAAWGLFIRTEENKDVVFNAWRIDDESVIQNDELGFMRFRDGAHLRTVAMCMNRPMQIVEPKDAILVEQWQMRDGSIVYDSGSKWYSMTNTGTTTATVVSLHSFNILDLEPLLLSPYSNTTSKWRLTWE
jgi:hypothetical protein